ncbi:MAG: ADP-forming succinate--CoA ligase subunit beta [Deltaproteobacteria bacterium]|nr:ADP-forming succinate--CoA ligase subunit beta [Deltaproteobacteria bacterium]
MKVHEYQAKELLKKYGVPVPNGKIAASVDEATTIARELLKPTGTADSVVIKAQIHAGGRGKGGGIRLAKSVEEAMAAAQAVLGMQLVTPQTGPVGRKVKKVLVEEGTAIAKEHYLAITLDRARGRLAVISSAEGGMEIEEVAKRSHEKIVRTWIDPAVGLQSYQARGLGFGLGLPVTAVNAFVKCLRGLHKAYMEADCSLLEINPLVLTKGGSLIALDAKVTFDDSGLFRHPEIEAWRDLDEEDPVEMEAKEVGLNYVSLQGTIGCMVNGAGLAMATMDIIKLCGGEPANFLDVGGGATTEQVTSAFKIILRDPKVRAILINIFGGIMKCDVIADGIIAAAKELQMRVPVVVRLQGTNAEEGRRRLAGSGLPLIPVDGFAQAAQRVVDVAKGNG